MPRCCTEASGVPNSALPSFWVELVAALAVCPERRRRGDGNGWAVGIFPAAEAKPFPFGSVGAVPLGLGALALLEPGFPARQEGPGVDTDRQETPSWSHVLWHK